ncbi:MAG: hypothetical protein KDE32_02655 [Novosphingobium sp.]|nr:hypothetical protein [Novosphingobium sp.]
MIVLPRIAIAALGVLALSACGSEPEQATGPAESSKVLEGSTSDAMIPYETLRSEPPAAQIELDEAKGGSGSSSSAGSTAGVAATTGQDKAPAATPAAEPAPEAAE